METSQLVANMAHRGSGRSGLKEMQNGSYLKPSGGVDEGEVVVLCILGLDIYC